MIILFNSKFFFSLRLKSIINKSGLNLSKPSILQLSNELSTFIVKGASYAADDGCNDDLVACMFLFGWATDQTYFKELTDNDIRKTMMKEQQDALEQDMAPFGFIINGLEDENYGESVDEFGTRWTPVVRDYTTDW